MGFMDEARRLREWADQQDQDTKEWERAYPHWIALHAEAERMLASTSDLSEEQVAEFVYALARDNHAEFLGELLGDHHGPGAAVAHAALESDDFEARWQATALLGRFDDDASLATLRGLVEDDQEYVRRHALVALRDRDPEFAEPIARTWIDAPHEYSRLAALSVLRDLESPHLARAVKALRDDPFEHVRRLARQLAEPEAADESSAAEA